MSCKYIKELATGAVNGVNTLFSTSVDYAPGQLVHFLNGQAQHVGLVELGGKDFQLDCAPYAGSVISVYYRRI